MSGVELLVLCLRYKNLALCFEDRPQMGAPDLLRTL